MAGSGTALVPCDAFAVTCTNGGDAELQWVTCCEFRHVLSMALDRCQYSQLYEATRNRRPPGVTPFTSLL